MNVFEELVEAGAEALAEFYGVTPQLRHQQNSQVALTAALERALEPDVSEEVTVRTGGEPGGMTEAVIRLALRALLDQKETSEP